MKFSNSPNSDHSKLFKSHNFLKKSKNKFNLQSVLKILTSIPLHQPLCSSKACMCVKLNADKFLSTFTALIHPLYTKIGVLVWKKKIRPVERIIQLPKEHRQVHMEREVSLETLSVSPETK